METYEELTNEIAENIGIGVHTSLRKSCDSEGSHKAWLAIKAMDSKEWSNVAQIVGEHTVNSIIKPFMEQALKA